MAVGQGAVVSSLSYLALGRETTLGTYTTCTAGLEFMSASMKTVVSSKIIEQLERSRAYSKRISLGKKVEGELEVAFAPIVPAMGFIMQNAFGGTVTSLTATGETNGAGANSAMQHTFNIGFMDQSYPSLCLNMRKGDSLGGKVFQYNGVRVNEISFQAALDEPLMCSASLIAMDSTQVANDVASALTTTTAPVLSFVDGRLSVETSFASLTTSSLWHVVSTEFGWQNNLKADNDSRRIGSNVLTVLPVGMATFSLKCRVRFDTTTAFSAMINATKLSAQLEFLGPTLPSSAIRQGIRFNFPAIYVKEAGDPTISGPDEILMSDVEFDVMRDDTSGTGYALQALLTNTTTSFA